MTINKNICPHCGSDDTDNIDSITVCFKCRKKFKPPLIIPDGLSPSAMPSYLALPWNAYLNEHHPRVKLVWLIDCAEAGLRFLIALCLAEILHNSKQLPDKLHRIKIKQPSLGEWAKFLRDAIICLPSNPFLLDDIQSTARNVSQMFNSEHYKGYSATVDNSFLVMRNQVVHGGGLSTNNASHLIQAHNKRLESMMQSIMTIMQDVQIFSLTEGNILKLVGIEPEKKQNPPKALFGKSEGPWLYKNNKYLQLFPLMTFGRVLRKEISGRLIPAGSEEHVPHIYMQTDDRYVIYTPYGTDEVRSYRDSFSSFCSIFPVDRMESRGCSMTKSQADLSGNDEKSQEKHLNISRQFIAEALTKAESIVGRKSELEEIQAWIDQRLGAPSRKAIGWIEGSPGIGKSYLMSGTVSQYFPEKEQNRPEFSMFYHRFGDSHNDRISFLRSFKATLCDWSALSDVAVKNTDQPSEESMLLTAIDSLLGALAERRNTAASGSQEPVILCCIDGLDEIVSIDPILTNLIMRFAMPGTIWLVAGRPDFDLASWGREHCQPVFPNYDVPSMKSDEIRALLCEQSNLIFRKIVSRDKGECEGAIENDFIEATVKRADGRPIYVKYLCDDLANNRISIENGGVDLPPSLDEYYSKILKRHEVSGGQSQLLTDVVGLLSRSDEPLDIDALALLLAPEIAEACDIKPDLCCALNAGLSMFRKSKTLESTDGYSLNHQSFQDHIEGSPQMKWPLRQAEISLCKMTASWQKLPEGNLRNHLFRWGNSYSLRWHKDDGISATKKRLTDYGYLHARTKALGKDDIVNLINEYQELLKHLPRGSERDELLIWEGFFRSNAPILRRAHDKWPVYKILLQLATEHGDESEVTIASEKWLSEGNCNWLWLRSSSRPVRPHQPLCLQTYHMMDGPIGGVEEYAPGTLIAWTTNGKIRIFGVEEPLYEEVDLNALVQLSGVSYTCDDLLGGMCTYRVSPDIKSFRDTSGIEQVRIEDGTIVVTTKVIDFVAHGILVSHACLSIKIDYRDGNLTLGSVDPLEKEPESCKKGKCKESLSRFALKPITDFESKCDRLTVHPESFGKVIGYITISDGTVVSFTDTGFIQRWPGNIFDIPLPAFFNMSSCDCVVNTDTIARITHTQIDDEEDWG